MLTLEGLNGYAERPAGFKRPGKRAASTLDRACGPLLVLWKRAK